MIQSTLKKAPVDSAMALSDKKANNPADWISRRLWTTGRTGNLVNALISKAHTQIKAATKNKVPNHPV